MCVAGASDVATLYRPLPLTRVLCCAQESYLKEYKKCLVMVSHSQDFLNGVCTHIIWLTHGKLTYYTGNYDTYCKTVAENEIIQAKKYAKEQEGAPARCRPFTLFSPDVEWLMSSRCVDIKHIKEFIASCGTYANLVRQAKSKQKILDKMYEAGLTPPVVRNPPPPVPYAGCHAARCL